MRHLLFLIFLTGSISNIFACDIDLNDNIETPIDLKYFINEDLESYTKEFSFKTSSSEQDQTLLINSKNTSLSYKIYSLTDNCTIGSLVHEESSTNSLITIDLSPLVENSYFQLSITINEIENSQLLIKKISTPNRSCDAKFNHSNSQMNPVDLDISTSEFMYEDCNIGILPENGYYAKWYRLNPGSQIKYVDIELNSDDDIDSWIELYFTEKERIHKVKLSHLYQSEATSRIPFVNIGDGKVYLLKVIKRKSSNTTYNLLINNISSVDFDISKVASDTLVVKKATKLINQMIINPGDTISVEYSLKSWLPFNQTWFHSITFSENEYLTAVSPELQNQQPFTTDGKFYSQESQLPIDSFPAGVFKGDGYYYQNTVFGPYGRSPNYTWGIKPLLANQSDEPLFTITQLFIVSSNFDCSNQSTITIHAQINTDYETGFYDFRSNPIIERQLEFDVICCQSNTQEQYTFCNDEEVRVLISQSNESHTLQYDEAIWKFESSNLLLKDPKLETLNDSIFILNNSGCADTLKYNIIKLPRFQASISMDKTKIDNKINVLLTSTNTLKEVEWYLDDEYHSEYDDMMVFENSSSLKETVRAILTDENNCETILENEVSRFEDSVTTFSINPNPNNGVFSLFIFTTSKSSNSHDFKANFLDNKGHLVATKNKLSFGDNNLALDLPAGTYACQLLENGKPISTKTIIILQ